MSTRGLTGFRLDGTLKAMYNHSDSYPEHLGQQVVEFCRLVEDWSNPIIKERVANVKLVRQDAKPSKKKILKYAKYANLALGALDPLGECDWYSLLRDLQGVGILNQVIRGKVKHMTDDGDFLVDGLFCEWAYIINLDEETLEVWHKAKKLYEWSLHALPVFMLGITNEYKKKYDRNQFLHEMVCYNWIKIDPLTNKIKVV